MCYKIRELFRSHPKLEGISHQIENSFNMIKKSLANGGTLFTCGNGGSFSDSEHIVAELMKNFLIDRGHDLELKEKFLNLYGEEESRCIVSKLQPGIRSYALTGHGSFASAYSNDVDSEFVFAQQLFVMGRRGDILLGLSTSGNSENIYRALQVADGMGIGTVLYTGMDGGKCAEISKCSVKVPEVETYKVQELHLPIYHSLCAFLEEYFYGK